MFDLQRFAAKSGSCGRILQQTGNSTAFTAEAMTDAGNHLRYAITNAVKAYWNNAVAIVVETSVDEGENWTAVSTGFSIEYAGGNIVFAVARNAAHLFRVSGAYWPVAVWGGFLNWKLSLSVALLDSTTLESGDWKEFTPSLKEGSISADAFWQDETNMALLGAGKIALILFTDYGTALQRYETFAQLKGDSITNAVGELVKEALEFVVDGNNFYYREG